MTWYRVLNLKYSPEPFMSRAKINGRSVVLVNYEGDLHALSADCPHAGGNLGYGWCEDGKLICPLHRYAYDIKTGKGDPGQNDFIDTYPVKVRGQDVYIGMGPSFFEKLKGFFK